MQGRCPILGRPTAHSVVGSRDRWTLVRCEETGFVYLRNPPEYSQLVEEYAWEKSYEKEKARRQAEEPWVTRWSQLGKAVRATLFPRRNRFDGLARTAVRGTNESRFLDVGCGTGLLLEDLCQRYRRRGVKIRPCGIEISRQLASQSQERLSEFGGSVLFASAVDGLRKLDPQSFDVVILSCFLEHEAEPLELLAELHRVLADRGVVILKVPNYASWNRRLRGPRWCGYRFPDHVSYFTPETLRILADRAKFRVRQSLRDRWPCSDNMYAVLTKADS